MTSLQFLSHLIELYGMYGVFVLVMVEGDLTLLLAGVTISGQLAPGLLSSRNASVIAEGVVIAKNGGDGVDAVDGGSVRFDQPGIVRVFCDIHSHMNAFILVFAHRYFTVTDDDGRYRLPNVPAGSYTLTVWNETVRGDAPRRAIAIAAEGADVDADFTIR